MKNPDEPINPCKMWLPTHDGYVGYKEATTIGITKRELFAMNAMNAMLSSAYVEDFNGASANSNNQLARKALSYADALLEELKK